LSVFIGRIKIALDLHVIVNRGVKYQYYTMLTLTAGCLSQVQQWRLCYCYKNYHNYDSNSSNDEDHKCEDSFVD